VNRAGRFRSLGDVQVDFAASSPSLQAYDFDSWQCWSGMRAQHPEDGARGRREFIKRHIIRVTERASTILPGQAPTIFEPQDARAWLRR